MPLKEHCLPWDSVNTSWANLETQWNKWDGFFCENSYLQAVNYVLLNAQSVFEWILFWICQLGSESPDNAAMLGTKWVN